MKNSEREKPIGKKPPRPALEDKILAGYCRDCKHYILCNSFDIGWGWEDGDYKCNRGVFIAVQELAPPTPSFGCTKWEAKDE